MLYKGRTVIIIAIAAMLIGGLLTIVFSDQIDVAIFAREQTEGAVSISGAAGQQSSSRSTVMSAEQLKKIQSAYRLIHTQYFQEVQSSDVVDGAIRGMLNSLDDPYSTYMDAEQAEQFQDAIIESSFSGIGAEVTLQNGRVTVVAPIKDSPAEKAGIRAKDQIVTVNGESLDGLSLNEAVAKIRGKKGSEAKLEIKREGNRDLIEIVVIRDDIDIETVYAEMFDDGVGKIEIRQFSQDTAKRFEEELLQLEKEGMKGLVIDVRNNPGGILPVVIQMADLFIDAEHPIVQVEYRNGKREKYNASEGSKDYPIVVLTNNGSASASEILAVSLQEAANATIVGERTFGKGTVQSTFNTTTNDGSNVKLTIAQWLTPNGNSVGDGVEPDVEVQLPEVYYVSPLPKDKVLEYDMVGEEIKNLQMMLEALHFPADRQDGYYSEATQAAVKLFQQEHELEVTGSVDEETAIVLEVAVIEELSKPENDTQLNKALELMKEKLQAQ